MCVREVSESITPKSPKNSFNCLVVVDVEVVELPEIELFRHLDQFGRVHGGVGGVMVVLYPSSSAPISQKRQLKR